MWATFWAVLLLALLVIPMVARSSFWGRANDVASLEGRNREA